MRIPFITPMLTRLFGGSEIEPAENLIENHTDVPALKNVDSNLLMDVKALAPDEVATEASLRDATLVASVKEFIENVAGRVGTIWHAYAQNVHGMLSDELTIITTLRRSLVDSLTTARDALALTTSKFTDQLKDIYDREAVRAANRDMRIDELQRNMRGLRIAIKGDPDANIAETVVAIELLYLFLAFGFTAAIEFGLNLGLFQSESEGTTSMTISVTITIVGTLLVYLASRYARASNNYKNAVKQLNRLRPKLGAGPMDEKSGSLLSVEELSSNHRSMSLLVHASAIGFGIAILIIRFFIIFDKEQDAELGEILTNSLGTASVVVTWLLLYIIEIGRNVTNHPRLREYLDMTKELKRLLAERDDPQDSNGFLLEVEAAERNYANRCKELKHPAEVIVHNLDAAQERVREIKGWFTTGPFDEVLDSYFVLTHDGLLAMQDRALDAFKGEELPADLQAAYNTNVRETRDFMIATFRNHAPQWTDPNSSVEEALVPVSVPEDAALNIVAVPPLKATLAAAMETRKKGLIDAAGETFRQNMKSLARRLMIKRTPVIPPSQQRNQGGAK